VAIFFRLTRGEKFIWYKRRPTVLAEIEMSICRRRSAIFSVVLLVYFNPVIGVASSVVFQNNLNGIDSLGRFFHLPAIGSSDGDCAPPPSHTTGCAVCRIRRLNSAAYCRRKIRGKQKAIPP
jgi:hypothetical protein